MKLLRSPPPAVDATIQAAIAEAHIYWQPLRYEGEFPKSGFGIQALRPWHIFYDCTSRTMTGTYGSTTGAFWTFSFAAASTVYSIINNITTSERAYLCIEGFFSRQPDPKVTEVQFVINAEETPQINIEEMYCWDLAEAWLNKPFYIKPGTQLTMRAIASDASTPESFGILGHTIAKRPYLFSRTPTT